MSSVFNSKRTIVIGVAVFIFLRMQIESFAGEEWELITQIPTQREDFATAVVENKVYLIGGTLSKNREGPFGISTAEVYDTQTNTWRRVADMPTPRRLAKAAVVDGIIYIFGGYSSKDRRIRNWKLPLPIEAYNPQTDTWIQKQDMPVSRINFSLGVVDRKVYLIGGSEGFGDGQQQRMDRVDIYNPATDTWTMGPNMPTRRETVGVTAVNNRIYVIGGHGWPPAGWGPLLTVIEAYDPLSRRWQQKKDMLDFKSVYSRVVVGEAIYLIGGLDRFSQDLATVDVYNPEKEAWRDIPTLPTPLVPYGAASVNGKIYVFGGYSREGGGFIPDVVVFDTGFRAVTAKGKLSTRWGELKAAPPRNP